MSKFSMKDLLNSHSKAEAHSGPENMIELEYIDIDSISPDKNNFYSISDIERLADSIAMVGLQQILVVRPNKAGGYTLISGHRRLEALRLLVQHNPKYRKVPCKVEAEQSNIDEMFNELRLIEGNATTRQHTDYEKTQQAARLKDILLTLKKRGVNIPGRLRDLIAETLNTSAAKVGRMENVANNLIPEFQQEFQKEAINLSVANELAGMPEDEQKAAYEDYRQGEKMTMNDVKERKAPSPAPAPAPYKAESAKEPEPPTAIDAQERQEDCDQEPTTSLDMAKCPACGKLFDAVSESGRLDHFHQHSRSLQCPHCGTYLAVTISSVEWFCKIIQENE